MCEGRYDSSVLDSQSSRFGVDLSPLPSVARQVALFPLAKLLHGLCDRASRAVNLDELVSRHPTVLDPLFERRKRGRVHAKSSKHAGRSVDQLEGALAHAVGGQAETSDRAEIVDESVRAGTTFEPVIEQEGQCV